MALDLLDKTAELIISTRTEFRLLYVFILVPMGIYVTALLFSLETIVRYRKKFSCRKKLILSSCFLIVKILVVNWYLRGVDKHQLIDGKSLMIILSMIVTGLMFSFVPLWIVKNTKFL